MSSEIGESIETLGNWKRTHDCGSLRSQHIGEEVTLMGWVNGTRDLGSLIFIDLRDREGLTQLVFDQAINPDVHRRARELRHEWVIGVKGVVSPREEGQENPELPTGEVEVKVKELKVLNRSDVPPFQVDGAVDASETLRLKYRYLEFRRKRVFENFRKRHQIASIIREYLNGLSFVEVETPFLTKSTPEGARDYLVPSRVNRGKFYALPQSPQLFKQLLMIGGFDRYYQMVRCFRDEDLRADRQPEFTQVDLEMSFENEDGVIEVVEGMMKRVFKEIKGRDIEIPFPRLTYQEAMARFGTDRPDLRFGLEIRDVTESMRDTEFRVLRDAVKDGGVIKAINVNGGSSLSRKAMDELSEIAVSNGAKGLLWAKVKDDGWQSTLSRFFDMNRISEINGKLNASSGDLILFVADNEDVVNSSLGAIRIEVAKRLNLIKEKDSFVWITHFPLLEFDQEEGRFVSVHHPFTSPLDEDMELLKQNPEKARSRAYDIVLNGVEIGGGSVRIHDISLQRQVFKILNISEDEAQRKFGFFMEALRYGAPPHAGIALGFDRLVAMILGAESIRDVIAFPKTQRATCPLSDAPSEVDSRQLDELGITIKK